MLKCAGHKDVGLFLRYYFMYLSDLELAISWLTYWVLARSHRACLQAAIGAHWSLLIYSLSIMS